MTQPYLGQIIQGGWNFAPRGYHMCDGSVLSISQNTALFSLLGTTYGGNGTQTFGLPDLRGRSGVGTGTGPGLTPFVTGQVVGAQSVTLQINNLPAHNHIATFSGAGSSLNAASSKATSEAPIAGGPLGKATDGAPNPASNPEIYSPNGTAASVALSGLNVAGTVTVALTGGNIPVSIQNPVLAITQVIALQGIFPTRN